MVVVTIIQPPHAVYKQLGATVIVIKLVIDIMIAAAT